MEQSANAIMLIAILFGVILAAGIFLRRFHIPFVLPAVICGVIASSFISPDIVAEEIGTLSELGLLFLLFYIGLQLDLSSLAKNQKSIIKLTVFSALIPFLLSSGLMLAYGYSLQIALIIGVCSIPVAEAVAVPMLDEFKLLNTRVGQYIVGTGVLDDIFELILMAAVSIWAHDIAVSDALLPFSPAVNPFIYLALFFITLYLAWRWLSTLLKKTDMGKRLTALLCFFILMLMSFLTVKSMLGEVIGAISAGVLVKKAISEMDTDVGDSLINTIELITYGFFGIFFFFHVGFLINLDGLLTNPTLALILASFWFLGKLLAAYCMIPSKELTFREANIIGVGTTVKMTTELVVAQILLKNGLIDDVLYTAIITAASITMLVVPLGFTLLMRKTTNAV